MRQAWAEVVGYEVSIPGGIADAIAVTDPMRLAACPEHRVAFEAHSAARSALWERLRAAALAGSSGRWLNGTQLEEVSAAVDSELPWPVAPIYKSRGAGRVAVFEVKRTRSDLLGDLRRGKMLRYEVAATHCYLAVGPDVLRGDWYGGTWAEQVTELGLPKHWGILSVKAWKGYRDGVMRVNATSVRPARRIRPTTAALVWPACTTIAKATSYKLLRGIDEVNPEAASP